MKTIKKTVLLFAILFVAYYSYAGYCNAYILTLGGTKTNTSDVSIDIDGSHTFHCQYDITGNSTTARGKAKATVFHTHGYESNVGNYSGGGSAAVGSFNLTIPSTSNAYKVLAYVEAHVDSGSAGPIITCYCHSSMTITW